MSQVLDIEKPADETCAEVCDDVTVQISGVIDYVFYKHNDCCKQTFMLKGGTRSNEK